MTGPSVSSDSPSAHGVRLRPFAGDPDFARMAGVANASFAADGIDIVRRAEDMRRDYAAMTRWDPSRDIVMAEVDGELAGYARTWDWTTGEDALVQGQIAFVHPSHRRRGVGSALLQWLEARQREVARTRARATNWHQAIVTEREVARTHLLQNAGYQVARRLFEMERPTLDELPDFPLPAGFEVRAVQPEHLRAIYDAHMDAVRDVWGYSPPQPGDFEAWQASRTFQPHLWQVAWHLESNEVAGQVKPWIDAEQNETLGRKRGFTEFISVRAPWRKRGLARALVVRALRAQQQAGMLESALGVDGESAFRTTRLYEDCGFVVVKRNALYRKAVDLDAIGNVVTSE
jgi:mycothiol synthase